VAITQEQRRDAERLRGLLTSGPVQPAQFCAELLSVPAGERDAWLDVAFGLEAISAEDGPQLPVNCTPYLPCPVDTVLRALDYAQLDATDVFVDVGSGVGRAALLAQLATGARAVGLEIQPTLAQASRALAQRLNVLRFTVLEGDAPALIDSVEQASVFFLYCPFGGERLERSLQAMARAALARPVHVCAVQLPPLARPWLAPLPLPEGELAVYRSTFTR
jgi:SAM-dependent methyltransferase